MLGAAGVGATLYVLIPSRFKPTQRETDISATNGRSVDSFKPRESSDGEKNMLGDKVKELSKINDDLKRKFSSLLDQF